MAAATPDTTNAADVAADILATEPEAPKRSPLEQIALELARANQIQARELILSEQRTKLLAAILGTMREQSAMAKAAPANAAGAAEKALEQFAHILEPAFASIKGADGQPLSFSKLMAGLTDPTKLGAGG